jgi:ferredoxin
MLCTLRTDSKEKVTQRETSGQRLHDLDVPHDCKLGVCMTCPARLVAGEVDQSDGMLSAR